MLAGIYRTNFSDWGWRGWDIIPFFLVRSCANRTKSKHTFRAHSHIFFFTCSVEKYTVLIHRCTKYNELICGPSIVKKNLTSYSDLWCTGANSHPLQSHAASQLSQCMMLAPTHLPFYPCNILLITANNPMQICDTIQAQQKTVLELFLVWYIPNGWHISQIF